MQNSTKATSNGVGEGAGFIEEDTFDPATSPSSFREKCLTVYQLAKIAKRAIRTRKHADRLQRKAYGLPIPAAQFLQRQMIQAAREFRAPAAGDLLRLSVICRERNIPFVVSL